MRLIQFIFFLITLLSGCSSNGSAKIFGNMTYFFDNSWEPQATLVDGSYEKPFFNVYYDNKYVYGDFNRDGLKDAAVIIVENSGGGNICRRLLAFLINDGEKLVHKTSEPLGDRVIINRFKERRGKVFIDMFIHHPNDCMGGPTRRVKRFYDYLGPELNELEKLSKSIFPKEIRRNFKERTAARKEDCRDCTEEMAHVFDIYSEKFMVYRVEEADFGGYGVNIAIKKDRLRLFSLSLDEIGKDQYALQSIYEIFSPEPDFWAHKLGKEEYSRFFF